MKPLRHNKHVLVRYYYDCNNNIEEQEFISYEAASISVIRWLKANKGTIEIRYNKNKDIYQNI